MGAQRRDNCSLLGQTAGRCAREAGVGRTTTTTRAVTFAVLAAALAAAVWWTQLRRIRPAEVLASYVGETRWTEGRSALPLPWRPWSTGPRHDDYGGLLVALHERPPSSQREFDLAMVQLYLRRAGTGDAQRAVERLRSMGDDAVVLNELALALHAAGRELEALEAALTAVERDPTLPAALFTRAVLLSRIPLQEAALEAWDAFLAVEPEGAWAAEARVRREELRALQQGERSVKGSTFDEVVKRLVDVDGPAALDELLADASLVQQLGELVADGEKILLHEIDYLRGLRPGTWQARAGLRERYKLEWERVLAGRGSWREVAEIAAASSDPLLGLRYLRLGLYDAVQKYEGEGARRLAELIEGCCSRYGCVEPTVLAGSDLASLLMGEGRFNDAEAALERALRAIGPTGNAFRRAEIALKMASLAWATGAAREASLRALQVIRPAVELRNDLLLASSLINLSAYATALELPTVGSALAREARIAADRDGSRRVVLLAAMSEIAALEAGGRLDEAEQLAIRLYDDAVRSGLRRMVLQASLHLARVRMRTEHAESALQVLDAVPDPEGMERDIPEFLVARARAEEMLGRSERAGASLRKALEASRSMVENATSRLAAFRLRRDYNAIAARYAAWSAQRDDAGAIWELVGPSIRQLDGDECLAAQLEVDGRWAEWIADTGGTRFTWIDAPRSPLRSGACPRGTRRLTLVDLPGGAAARLSRLVRQEAPDVAVVLSSDPSAPWPDATVTGPALVVHSPRIDRIEFSLGYLPNAPREAALVRAALAGSEELRSEMATPAKLFERAAEFDLLHFGVHGENRAGSDEASFLLLGGREGLLEVVDILRLPLEERRPVVVLAACRAAGEMVSEVDGGGLAWAFRTAGARAVIAYQDVLDDDVALTFSRAFYGAIGKGAGLSPAFERAVDAVRREHAPEAAAAFVLAI